MDKRQSHLGQVCLLAQYGSWQMLFYKKNCIANFLLLARVLIFGILRLFLLVCNPTTKEDM